MFSTKIIGYPFKNLLILVRAENEAGTGPVKRFVCNRRFPDHKKCKGKT
jgi:hypothetical protein